MENPTPTPQRRRRSERYQQDAASSSVYAPFIQADSAEPVDHAAPAYNMSAAYQRVPRNARAASIQHVPQTSQASAIQSVPQTTQSVPQSSRISAIQSVPQTTQSVPQPRVLQHAPQVSAFLREEAPPAMARPRKAAPLPEKKPAPRMPLWLTSLIIGLLVLILALTAAQNMMAAYLTQQRDARAAVYQKIVSNHPLPSEQSTMDAILRYSEEYNLQPAFVCSIIMNESSFRTRAESDGIGARGLMQLRQTTAEWIADKLDVENFHFDRMYDAQTNVRFGCWYLNYLSKLFRGDPILVACAYHAGQSNVTAWLSNRSYSADGRTIPLAKIPTADSKTYAERVIRDYGIYDALYFHVFNQPAAADSDAAAQSVFADLPAFR